MKAYTGYYRFSEDVDFTWRDASIWDGRSKSETVRRCSAEIDRLLERFGPIARALGFSFRGDKRDRDEVHIGSGGRMALFFIGYKSDVLTIPGRIKVELNFVDRILYPAALRKLKSFIDGLSDPELEFIFEKPWNDYAAPAELFCYDAREIYAEKCRAALTRKTYKLRDILDIIVLERAYGYSVAAFRTQILEKVRFMLDLYRRYSENIDLMSFPSAEALDGEEVKLLLGPPGFDVLGEIRRIHGQLDGLKGELMKPGNRRRA